MTNQPTANKPLRIALVVPHIFLHKEILPHVIFSPGRLAVDLAEGLQVLGAQVTLFSPGPVATTVKTVGADLSYFERELAGRGDSYLDLLKKHPFTFITLARQVQAEIIAKAYTAANAGEFDIVHIYTNEEDTALPFAQLCQKPVIFTHHDPFNFLVKYKNVFPKYQQLNWVSMSLAQRSAMPKGTNWVANIYHGLKKEAFAFEPRLTADYVAFMGRLIAPKGAHLAIAAAKQAGVPLKIAGKHYSGAKDSYWQESISPALGRGAEYVGFLREQSERQAFLANARALIVPSTFDEPFGMVVIEALACGTPVIGMRSGAIPELIEDGVTGFVVDDEAGIAEAIRRIDAIDRTACRKAFERRFTLNRMCQEHAALYVGLTSLSQ
ncbi:MAG TPA: glycosyltransferase [Candidatus Saccharimonadales bacterium]|nr:glycosyltransferase [Candidatus Saccharimonadales bacterium]